MENFVEFLLHYYRELILGVSIVLELSILIFKKTKVAIDLPLTTYDELIDLVNEAEKQIVVCGQYESGLSGEDKRDYVLRKFCERHGLKLLGETMRCYLCGLIELILNTPTKKGGPGREDEEA